MLFCGGSEWQVCLMCHGGVILEKWWLQNWVNTEPIKERFPHTMFGASWLKSTCCGKFWETCEDFSPRAGISRRVEIRLCRWRHRTALCPVLPAWPHITLPPSFGQKAQHSICWKKTAARTSSSLPSQASAWVTGRSWWSKPMTHSF